MCLYKACKQREGVRFGLGLTVDHKTVRDHVKDGVGSVSYLAGVVIDCEPRLVKLRLREAL